ncbi:hypothetical protein [Elizabethkingia anophelis]|uniref:hypothetical protein n=1 Tax=Elizabethkingia anophelis TaxID=1117645 RepID=UPI0021A96780|nr:hypothetical protein [Elizabethkingia anophelis]
MTAIQAGIIIPLGIVILSSFILLYPAKATPITAKIILVLTLSGKNVKLTGKK